MDIKIIKLLLGIISSYSLGAIPSAYILGRVAKGIDLRKHGSGNLGATNAFRILGPGIGTAVLVLDILKGTLAVLLAKFIFFQNGAQVSENLFLCICAITAVIGHNWTIFMGFKGGKGIATSLGALIAFAIIIDRFAWLVISIILLWLIIFMPTGLVSLASVISSIFLPIIAIFLSLPKEIIAFLIIISIFSIIRHKHNIRRLLQKKESRFNTRAFFSKSAR